MNNGWPRLPPTLHPPLSNQSLISFTRSFSDHLSHHMGQESTKTVGDMQILWSFLGSWAFSVLNKLASSSSSKGGQWIPKKFWCASWFKDFEMEHPGQLGVLGPSKGSSQAVSLGLSTPSPSLHTTLVDWGARERLGNKGGFHPEPADGGGLCSPEAGSCPVTLSSKMCEISFCWVFYIKRNLFSEKHSISQTLMAFLCADALMRLRLILIRRKPCR